jgi:hypothetical protein
MEHDKSWDKNNMINAMADVKEHKMGYLAASKTYGVPKIILRELRCFRCFIY